MKLSLTISDELPSGVTTRAVTEFDFAVLDQRMLDQVSASLDHCCRAIGASSGGPPNGTSLDGTGVEPAAAEPAASRGRTDRNATPKQIAAIRGMAARKQIELARTLHDRFGVSELESLTLREASTLIDELKGNGAAV